MRTVDLITRKKEGGKLTEAEFSYIVSGFIEGDIPDYQMSALLMAIRFAGLDGKESWYMTKAMLMYGDTLDLSSLPGIKVDKHSTGGIGDKTTLIVIPMVAAAGVYAAKMSGRGLGDTGGTIDKLESVPGWNTDIPPHDFLAYVNKTGACVCGHSSNFAAADSKIYNLRNLTSTTDATGLIASSIMSKKIASGADKILLDVKAGSGAFMKTLSEARELAKICKEIGAHAGKEVRAAITNMDVPLGNLIGNSLEIKEAVDVLNGGGPDDVRRLCILLASHMLNMADKGSLGECAAIAEGCLKDGTAFKKFLEMGKDAGADIKFLENPDLFDTASVKTVINSPESGCIERLSAADVGRAAFMLGAGRAEKTATIDYAAGVELLKKQGDMVTRGEPILVLHSNNEGLSAEAEEFIKRSIRVSGNVGTHKRNIPLVHEII